MPDSLASQTARFDLATYADRYLVRDNLTGLLRCGGNHADTLHAISEYNADPELAALSQAQIKKTWFLSGRETVNA